MGNTADRAEWLPKISHNAACKCIGSPDIDLFFRDRSRRKLEAFQQPGTRNPGSHLIYEARTESVPSVRAIVAQSAPRSNIARTRSMMKKSEQGSPI